jgi:DNA-binding NtrC family response regulator
MYSILVIEEDIDWRNFLLKALDSSYALSFWPNHSDIFKLFIAQHYHLVILDLDITREDPFNLLNWLNSSAPHMPVILTSRTENVDLVVTAVKKGASDFVIKPYLSEKIGFAVQKAIQSAELQSEIDYLRHKQDVIYDFNRIVAFSPSMKRIIDTLKKYSHTDTTVLMTGETGTGKSFLSGSIHFNSPRRKKPFVVINCSNIQENLLESELFGHERGAFTSADKLRIGRFEQAQGGTIFLDEIGELGPSLQAKLLRVLENKSFERLGGNNTIYSDVRIIVATNKNLEALIADGQFREDLFYRINTVAVHLPPLKERRECIEPLAYWLLDKISRALRKRILGFSPEVIQIFQSYGWPGNVRQMANIIESSVILEESPEIQKATLPLPDAAIEPPATAAVDPVDALKRSEQQQIIAALEDNLWIQKEAARSLGISPRALNYKIKKYGITHHRWRKNR